MLSPFQTVGRFDSIYLKESSCVPFFHFFFPVDSAFPWKSVNAAGVERCAPGVYCFHVIRISSERKKKKIFADSVSYFYDNK